jgi:hypothetical protein
MTAKTKLPYTLTTNADNCTVLITYATGRTEYAYPFAPILERLAVSLEDRGNKYEKFCYRLLRYEGDPLANWQGAEQAARIMPPAALAAAEQMVGKLWRQHDKAIVAGRKTWQYRTCLAQTAPDLPRLFATDLTNIDAYWFATRAPDNFLWSVRECGTNLYTDDLSLTYRTAYDPEETKYYHVTPAGAHPLSRAQFANFKLCAA